MLPLGLKPVANTMKFFQLQLLSAHHLSNQELNCFCLTPRTCNCMNAREINFQCDKQSAVPYVNRTEQHMEPDIYDVDSQLDEPAEEQPKPIQPILAAIATRRLPSINGVLSNKKM